MDFNKTIREAFLVLTFIFALSNAIFFVCWFWFKVMGL